ncbi:CobW family GTP-binding protein [Pseudomonas parafulva]|uniref:Cobalamin biosynthesis protein CobW n=1 Tax=Pseudomonas parafulva TaxID=157782 RepID=A0ABM6J7Z4_9PSED|nr:CobW family GTP-binding protein [Pseudomonas parafulva]AQW70608.1 cobalamin biosynthesis protein CobW [Pseudomonas parafulva]
MLRNIPTHVIAGPLGAGKTTLIHHLLQQKPDHERWAVLVNEFGAVGLDAALLSTSQNGITIAEVAGGCLCCVNGVPFQVGLSRLLRQCKPHRLFIEPSGLGHPLQLLDQLTQAPWHDVLTVQPLVVVATPASLRIGKQLPTAQSAALEACETLVINKSEVVDKYFKLLINKEFSGKRLIWATQGRLPLKCLPVHQNEIVDSPNTNIGIVDNLPKAPLALWTNRREPICQVFQGEDGWSIGWRWHPAQRFYPQAVDELLKTLTWRRAKGVINTAQGRRSFNALEGELAPWQPSEWAADSRLELIFERPQPVDELQARVQECLMP